MIAEAIFMFHPECYSGMPDQHAGLASKNKSLWNKSLSIPSRLFLSETVEVGGGDAEGIGEY